VALRGGEEGDEAQAVAMSPASISPAVPETRLMRLPWSL
jgi:hypothetical protein